MSIHSANPPGISCILLTNLAASDSGSFKGLLGQIMEEQGYGYLAKTSEMAKTSEIAKTTKN